MKKDKVKEAVIEQLRKIPIIEVACSKAGIGRTTFYRWKKEDQGFAELIDIALREGLAFVSDMAESQLISAIKDGQMPAIVFWLRNRHEDYKTKVEISGRINQADETLTPEQEATVREALRLAALTTQETKSDDK
ncbi:MAG: hypothetical protein L7H18_03715 [Candidatus Nealsonbacteria bacterium DGGOD1a]|jgi:hypothetical protein|nr:MAG: hypothetical protein L7H18_03715 [Candidatus Nealsonbacteria bacterium DGGOD1a]